MTPSQSHKESASSTVDGQVAADLQVTFDHRGLEFHFSGRRGIHLYTFNSQMFPIQSARSGKERYTFSGPRLGMYHETADPREGPFVNHFIDRLEINITYCSSEEASLIVTGIADRSKSSIDHYWYKGPVSGDWSFEVRFMHIFPSQ